MVVGVVVATAAVAVAGAVTVVAHWPVFDGAGVVVVIMGNLRWL